MAYTPTVWATGDVITAEKLNKMENGIKAANVFYATYTPTSATTATCDKTYAEIAAALSAGSLVIAKAVTSADVYQLLPMVGLTNVDGTESVLFALIDATASYVMKLSLEHSDADEITLATITYGGQ